MSAPRRFLIELVDSRHAIESFECNQGMPIKRNKRAKPQSAAMTASMIYWSI